MAKSALKYYVFSGVNNVDPADRLKQPDSLDPSAELAAGVNVDLDNSGGLSRRDGYTLRVAGDFSSFWSNGEYAFVVQGGDLYRVNNDLTLTLLLADVGTGRLSYDFCEDTVYFSNLTANGYVTAGAYAPYATPTDPNKAAPPNGQVVCFAFGRLFIAAASGVYFTDMGRLQIDSRKNYLPIPGTVTMIAPAKDGLYIGTNRATYFLAGTNPLKSQLLKAADYGMIPGTLASIDGEFISKQGTVGATALWLSPEGLCAGYASGQIVNKTRARYRMPSGATGALIVLDKGYKQVVGTVGTSALAMNAFTGGVTEFTNFPFNSFGVFNGKAYGASATGIYELTGDSDAGTAIAAHFTPGTTDGGTHLLKRITEGYLDVACAEDQLMEIDLSTDGSEALPYFSQVSAVIERPASFQFARGDKGRDWTITIRNVEGGDFAFNSVVLPLAVLQRGR